MLEYAKYYIFNLNSSDYQAHTLLSTYSNEFGIQKTHTNTYRYMLYTYNM